MWLSPLFPLKKCLAFHKYTQLFFIVVIYWKWLYFILKNRSGVNFVAVLRALDSTFGELLQAEICLCPNIS